MDPIWLKQYQPGVPHTIDPDAFPNLNALFADAISKYKDLPAFTNMGQVLTYAQVDEKARHFASFLQNQLELPRGERVAIMMPNLMQYPIAMLGILRAGCTVVNVNPLYTHDEFVVQMRDSEATTIVVLENFAHIVTDSIAETKIKHVIVAKISDVFPSGKAWLVDFVVRYIKRIVPAWKFERFHWFNDALAIGKQYAFKDMALGSEEIAFLQYTGGTTGPPKGAMLTHRNMVANVLKPRLG